MRYLLLLLLFNLCAFTVRSQSFTEYLQRKQNGEGTVILYQNDKINQLVEGSVSKASNSSITSQQRDARHSHNDEDDELNIDGSVRKVKMMGFRIQIYAGTSSRESRTEAQSAARNFKVYFPELPVYTHFYNPRWICRVGDFRTVSEAREILKQMYSTNQFKEATIVKSLILVPAF